MRSIIVTIAAILALSACAVDGDDPPATTPETTPTTAPAATEPEQTTAPTTETEDPAPAAGTQTVEIVDFTFAPGDIEVPAGTTVKWVQADDSLHTVDFDDGEKSGDLEKGATYSRTFTEPGTYPYVCFYHPNMTATITVTG